MTAVAFVLSLGYVGAPAARMRGSPSIASRTRETTGDSLSAFIPPRLSSSARSNRVGDASAAQECREGR